MVLGEKVIFYKQANELKSIFFDIAAYYNESCFYAGPFFEGENYCHWSNMDSFEIVRLLKDIIKNKQYLKVSIPDTEAIVDKITEGNLRYFSQIAFFLPESQLLFQVYHHTGALLLGKNMTEYASVLQNIILPGYFGWGYEYYASYYYTKGLIQSWYPDSACCSENTGIAEKTEAD